MLHYLLFISFLSLEALSCTEGEGFLPPNKLKIPANAKNTGLSEAEYHAAINKFETIYSPIVKNSFGAQLLIDRKWDNDRVNAGTLRRNNGKTWVINLYGGFARHPDITSDGYLLVMCHEIGHHIGGAPKKIDPESGKHWSSTEGQADYFATLKCLRKVFRKDDNAAAIKGSTIPKHIRNECKASFSTTHEIDMCIRIGLAGISVGNVNASIRNTPAPDIETTDQNVVDETYMKHPAPQCRLDTYFQGAICPVPSTKPVSQVNEVNGTCHPELGYSRGLRPQCWYKQ